MDNGFVIAGFLEVLCLAGIAVGAGMCFSAKTREQGCIFGIISAVCLIAVVKIAHAILPPPKPMLWFSAEEMKGRACANMSDDARSRGYVRWACPPQR